MTDDRRILEERARRLARRPETARAEATSELLFVSIGDERMAVDAARVLRVVPAPDITPIPGLPPVFHGVVNHQGEIVVVVDLTRLVADRPAPPELPLLVILGSDRPELAFGVTEADSIAGVTGVHALSDTPLVRGVLEGRRSVLDVDALIADPRLRVQPHA